MFGRYLLLCFTALLFAKNALATSSLPCTSPEECKSIMAHQFKIEYRTFLISFLKDKLYALENAAEDVSKADSTNGPKLNDLIKMSSEQRAILEETDTLSNEKLVNVIEKIKELYEELRAVNDDKVNIQEHLDRVRNRRQKLLEHTLEAWEEATILGRTFDTSQLPDYDSINEEVKKVKGVPITNDNEEAVGELVTRILRFFGVDESFIVVKH